MKNYYPILVSKSGETVALQHLEQKVKDEICPIIEVISSTLVKYKEDKETKVETMHYSDKFEKFLRTHWSFFDNKVILDFSKFENFFQHRDYINSMLIRLINNGVNIALAVQVNSNGDLKDIIRNLADVFTCDVCFRFSNDSGGFLNMNNDLESMMEDCNVEMEDSYLLMDLGQIERNTYNTVGLSAGTQLQNLDYDTSDFKSVIVSSSSFPSGLSNFESRDEPHKIVRYEWALFHNLKAAINDIKYGDYGTKAAFFKEVSYQGSVSLKYSTPKEFLIFRGQRTTDHHLGHGQFIVHAGNLVQHDGYSGNDFSWGDIKYHEISNKDQNGKPGNSTNWVQFSQNHHITLMNSIL